MARSLNSQRAGDTPATAPGGQQPLRLIADRYEMFQTLSGGMALVHLCRDQQTGQLVALKTFKPEYLSHRNARDLFLREGTMWVDIGDHPHIVRAYRVERSSDGLELYLVLEWVVQPEGRAKPSLRTWLRPRQPLPVPQALTFALHIARGMKYAVHRIPGLVHRDLKPENVLIGHDGVAKVTDFGLASTLSGLSDGRIGVLPNQRENMTRTQLTQGAAGTPLYMAPEQWARLQLDERADIYALGCVLYEMVTGRFAAYGETRQAVQEIHLTGRIKPPPPDVPREVVLFLRRCMVSQRHKRFRDWAEVERALVEVYRRVVGRPPPPERSAAETTAVDRLAAGHSYNTMGLSYLDIGKMSVAVMYFEQAVWIGREEKSLALEGAGLGNLGLAYQAMGYAQRAIEFHREHLAIARQIGDAAQETRALGHLGMSFRHLGRPGDAVKYHQRELYMAQELGDRFKEAAALDSLGDAFWQLKDVDQAVAHYRQSLVLARQIEDRARVKSILSSMGRIYLQAGNKKEAVALFQQALSLARKIGDRVGEGAALADMAYLYHQLGHQERAVEYYENALEIARESHDRRREAETLASLGELYLQESQYELARRHFEAALAAVEEIGNQRRQMQILSRLGLANRLVGDYMQAASLQKRVLPLARELEDRRLELVGLLELATAYERWGDVGRAIQYFKEYLALLPESGGTWEEERQVRSQVGPLYVRLNQLRPAAKATETYLERSRSAADARSMQDAYNQLGNLHRQMADPRQAVDFYRQALSLARDRRDGAGAADVESNLALAYFEMGRKWQSTRQMDRAVAHARRVGDPATVAQTLYKSGLLLCRHKKWSRALSPAKEAAALFARLEDQGMLQRTQKMMQAIAEQKEKSTGFLF